MKTQINVNALSVTGKSTSGLIAIVDMTENQMFSALNQFLHFVTDETWTKWQAEINGEIYGEKDAERYRFLKEYYALNDGDCEGAFKKLAFEHGAGFDAVVDAAMSRVGAA